MASFFLFFFFFIIGGGGGGGGGMGPGSILVFIRKPSQK